MDPKKLSKPLAAHSLGARLIRNAGSTAKVAELANISARSVTTFRNNGRPSRNMRAHLEASLGIPTYAWDAVPIDAYAGGAEGFPPSAARFQLQAVFGLLQAAEKRHKAASTPNERHVALCALQAVEAVFDLACSQLVTATRGAAS